MYPHRFVKNPDNEHCLQACFAMVWEQLLGDQIDIEQADELTGRYNAGGCWPFQAMLTLADLGFRVTSIEDLPIQQLVDEPALTIRQSGIPLAAVLHTTDLAVESQRARACIDHERISFVERPPRLGDLRLALEDYAVITGLNAAALEGGDTYGGHFAVPTSFDGPVVTMDDPGGTPTPGRQVPEAVLRRAWTSPTPAAGCLILIRHPRPSR
jgi:hypothetical protein